VSGIGPQSPNFVTTRPANDAIVSLADTWFADCSAPGANDGTIVTASFLNVIVAQLRTAILSAGITLDDSDDTMLQEAIKALCIALFTASNGINQVGSDFQLDLGSASNGTLGFAAIDTIADTIIIRDGSGAVIAETPAYNIVRAVLQGVTGATFDDTNGAITFAATRHTIQSGTALGAPTGVVFGDLWYDPDVDVLHAWTSDGVSSFWRQI
jgi:hypothetical protein